MRNSILFPLPERSEAVGFVNAALMTGVITLLRKALSVATIATSPPQGETWEPLCHAKRDISSTGGDLRTSLPLLENPSVIHDG